MDAFAVLVWWCYWLGLPGVALITCVVCRRYRVLLWLGGLLLILVVGVLFPCFVQQYPDLEVITMLYWLGLLPIHAAGTILLIGGLVRWTTAIWRGRRAPGSDQPTPEDDTAPGGPPAN
jgi:hypothetical protein